MVSEQTIEQTRELARVLLANDHLLKIYGAWVAALYPDFRREFQDMATKRKKGDIDLAANLREWFHEMGPKRILELGFPKQLFDDLGPDGYLAGLSAEQRESLLRHLQADSEKKRTAATS